jgi:hypothetical protein
MRGWKLTLILPITPLLDPDMTFTKLRFFGSTRRNCDEDTLGTREFISSLTLTLKVPSYESNKSEREMEGHEWNSEDHHALSILTGLNLLSKTPSWPTYFVLVKQTIMPYSHSEAGPFQP